MEGFCCADYGTLPEIRTVTPAVPVPVLNILANLEATGGAEDPPDMIIGANCLTYDPNAAW